MSHRFSLRYMLGFVRAPLAVAVAVALAACGTFQLASSVIPLSPKSKEQQQLDNLSCKDQAKLEANTAGRQAGAFALGMTIVGVPVAFEMEKSKQREVYKSCMEARGYRVLPPTDAPSSATPATAPAQTRVAPAVSATPGPSAPPAPSTASAPLTRDEAARLEKLKELRDKGLISEGEYEKKRKEILDRL